MAEPARGTARPGGRRGQTRQIVSGTDWRDCPLLRDALRQSSTGIHWRIAPGAAADRRAVPPDWDRHRMAGVYWRIAPGAAADRRAVPPNWDRHRMAEPARGTARPGGGRGQTRQIVSGTDWRDCPRVASRDRRDADPPMIDRRRLADRTGGRSTAKRARSCPAPNGGHRMAGTDWRAPIGGTAPYFERRSTACLTSSSGSGPPSSRYWR